MMDLYLYNAPRPEKKVGTLANPRIPLEANQMYVRSHEKPEFKPSELACVVCQLTFSTTPEYRKHLSTHLGCPFRSPNASLAKRYDFQLSFEFLPSNETNMYQLAVTNIAERSVCLGHLYIVNRSNAKLISIDEHSLEPGYEHNFQLQRNEIDDQNTNTIIMQTFKNGIEYIEYHTLDKCCSLPGIINKRHAPQIEQCPETKSLLAGPAKQIESHFRPFKSNKHRLDAVNYLSVNSKLNMVERIANQLELDSYHLENILTHETNDKRYLVWVPNVQDYMSRLSTFDTVRITDKTKLDLFITGDVDELQENAILIKLHKKQNRLLNNVKYTISFHLGSYTYDVEIDALKLMHQYNTVQYLFPSTVSTKPLAPRLLAWFNNDIQSNERQMQAVRHIVAGTAYPSPYLLFGPPGTGKTKTLVEAISQIHRLEPDSRILVCATSNAAADELALRIVRNLSNKCWSDHNLYRIYASSYEPEVPIDSDLRLCSNFDLKFCPEWTFLRKFRIIVATSMSGGTLRYAKVPASDFTHLFIDECGSATEIASLVPIAMCCSEGSIHAKIVLAGDPKQLGPVIVSKHADKMGYGRSLLERLMNLKVYEKDRRTRQYNPNVLTKLINNYRSHPSIIGPSNRLFYDGELRAVGGKEKTHCFVGWKALPAPQTPIIFHAAIRQSQRENNSKSIFNMHEVEIVVDYVERIMKETINGKQFKESDIGIISPYRKQCFKIKMALNNRNLRNIMVATVEIFQGKEKPVIIVSTARSQMLGIGFLKNPKRLNVLLTRAQSLMVIVGDPNTLILDKNWRRVLEDFQAAGVCTGCNFNVSKPNKNANNRKTVAQKPNANTDGKAQWLQLAQGVSSNENKAPNQSNPFASKQSQPAVDFPPLPVKRNQNKVVLVSMKTEFYSESDTKKGHTIYCNLSQASKNRMMINDTTKTPTKNVAMSSNIANAPTILNKTKLTKVVVNTNTQEISKLTDFHPTRSCGEDSSSVRTTKCAIREDLDAFLTNFKDQLTISSDNVRKTFESGQSRKPTETVITTKVPANSTDVTRHKSSIDISPQTKKQIIVSNAGKHTTVNNHQMTSAPIRTNIRLCALSKAAPTPISTTTQSQFKIVTPVLPFIDSIPSIYRPIPLKLADYYYNVGQSQPPSKALRIPYSSHTDAIIRSIPLRNIDDLAETTLNAILNDLIAEWIETYFNEYDSSHPADREYKTSAEHMRIRRKHNIRGVSINRCNIT